ncbi:MAG: hypothetical protein WA777_20180 [Rhodanobacter sp.]
MIVGKGLLAQAFEPYFGASADVLVFASGVSNSLETRDDEFAREHALLCRSLAGHAQRFVYFGSCGVATAEAELTAYMKHKKRMESLVLAKPGGLVLRLPQVVGRTENHHTLTNFLHDRVSSGEHFSVWSHAERNLIDIDDIAAIGAALAVEMTGESSAISIAAEKSLPMREIVRIFEHVLGKRANYSLMDKGATMDIDTTRNKQVSARLGIHLGDGYVEGVVRKYYAPSAPSRMNHPPSRTATDTTTTRT